VAGANTATLRRMLADRLVAGGQVRSREVAEAFRDVPRHLFVPGAEPAEAYADEAIGVKWAADGRTISSSSQPAIMAIMLEQLGLEPGQRILEIGTGTGYNAALLAHVAGGTGAVVSVEIDEELAGAARQRLHAAGYSSVVVAGGDGAAGWPAGSPYDRIIVTASARDLAPAWTSELGDGGILVLPLSLRGVHQSVAFKRVGEHLTSVSVVCCGFVPMTGELAGPDPVRQLGETPGIFLSLDDDRHLDVAALHAALGQPGQALPTGVTIAASDLFAGLGLWLALHGPGVGQLTAIGQAAERNLIPAVITDLPGMKSTTVLVGDKSLAAVVSPAGTQLATGSCDTGSCDTTFEACVRGYGPDSDDLAARLAASIRAWDSAGRPASSALRVRAWPASNDGDGERAAFIIERPHTRFLLDWS
jgi:protein-L-isoaspartate(D-aspartate) O-methyltransferase